MAKSKQKAHIYFHTTLSTVLLEEHAELAATELLAIVTIGRWLCQPQNLDLPSTEPSNSIRQSADYAKKHIHHTPIAQSGEQSPHVNAL